MATQTELNNLKKDFEDLQKKLSGLSKEELEQVAGTQGQGHDWSVPACNMVPFEDCENCPEKPTCARAK